MTAQSWTDPEPWVISSPIDGSAVRSGTDITGPVECVSYDPRTKEQYDRETSR